jgi:hypothetical protein
MKGENKQEAESVGKEMVPFGHVFFGRGYNTLDTRSFSMDVIYMTKLK